MYIALLGRQPELSAAEIERVFGAAQWLSSHAVLFSSPTTPDVQRPGGSQKLGAVVLDLPTDSWTKVSTAILREYQQRWAQHTGKITLGISAYNTVVPARDVQRLGLSLKTALKQRGGSLRLIPNQESILSSATAHHNKLGLSPTKVELLIVCINGRTIVAESIGAQNITALAARDQGRPRRDAFVGMLPPKLAQLMINLALGPAASTPHHLLDPFCGTGVLLQEALLLGHSAYGTDLSEKMIHYSTDNLKWLTTNQHVGGTWQVEVGDAMTTTWKQPVDVVVAEAYLGQPFSAPPSPAKLQEVRKNCDHIIGEFLRNIHPQLAPGTPLCIAIPAWKDTDGQFTHLPLSREYPKLGYKAVAFQAVGAHQLIYSRDDQVVGRELLVMVRQ